MAGISPCGTRVSARMAKAPRDPNLLSTMQIPTLASVGCCALAFFGSALGLRAETLAHWNFDGGSDNTTFAALPAVDISGKGYLFLGYDNEVGPSYSRDTPDGQGLSCRVNGKQDGYILEPQLINWSPLRWTIEISVKLDKLPGWNTIIGRDGSSFPGNLKSDFYFQNNGTNDQFRLDFATVDGSRYMIESGFAPVPGAWYHIALVSDGAKVEMYVDRTNGEGYKLASSTALSRRAGANNALASSGANWTFGRGWYDGKHVDHIEGCMDNVRFSDEALTPDQFVASKKTAGAGAESALTVARSGADVSLTWTQPSKPVARVEIHRHDRESAVGRQQVATIFPPGQIYIERVPDEAKTYWYWLVFVGADDSRTSVGPVATTSGDVWQP